MSSQPEQILFLEDDPKYRSVVDLALSSAGFEVTTAREAVQAMLLAGRNRYDLVITDYYLPDYPGSDFVRLLREIDEYKHVPVILLTARADELNSQYLREDLLVLVLSKLCSMKQLLDTVSKCLAIARCAP